MSKNLSAGSIVKNTIALYIRMLLIMGVSLYTSRVILQVLGVENFGIYNIVGGIVVLFAFLNTAMTTATQRFLSFELGKKEKADCEEVFSVSMTAHFTIILLVLLFAETVGLYFLNTYINIPLDSVVAANWVYQFSILALCFQIIQVPYNASIIAYEQMSVYAYISVFEAFFKLAVALLLSTVQNNRLSIYAGLIAFSAFLVLATYRHFCISKLPSCRYKFIWNGGLFKKLLGFTGWSMFGQVAFISANHGVNILLNIFYKVAINASMGIASQVGNVLYGFVSNFQTAFKPQIVKSYAAHDFDYLYDLIFRSSKISFYLLFILAMPVLFNIDLILSWWLETVPDYTAPFCQLIILYSLIETLSGPLWMTIFATGNIRNYQLVFTTVVLGNLVLSYIFLSSGFSPTIVLWVRLILNFGVLFVRLYYTKKAVNMPYRIFSKKVLLPIMYVSVISVLIIYFLSQFVYSFFSFCIIFIINIIIISCIIVGIGITKEERQYGLNIIRKKIKR